MSEIDALAEPTVAEREKSSAYSGEMPEIDLVTEWLPVDLSRSIEALAIATLLVLGWLLALWAYVKLTD